MLHSTRIYNGRVVSLRVDEIALPSGATTRREIVEHSGAVAIVPVTASGHVFLVRQFRAAPAATLLEIPAGTIEPGETVEACLHRELREETGLVAARLDPLVTFLPSPGFLTEEVHLYLAQDLAPADAVAAAAHEAEEEGLSIVQVPLGDAAQMVERGEIRDAKSIIGILLAGSRLRR